MPRNFKLQVPQDWRTRLTKDPRVMARVALGTLLLANFVAAYAVLYPVGGSAEELEEQISAMRSQLQGRQAALGRTRNLVQKIEQARASGDQFLTQYFMDRRTTSSTILIELDTAAKDAGMRVKERSFTYDTVEGSETLSMMTITANYDGTYGDLLEFVNRLDKSRRFLIVDHLVAQPQQGGSLLNVSLKLNTFVKEEPAEMASAVPGL